MDDQSPVFDGPLHVTGEQVTVPSHAMRQALAWWVGAELVRRHPNELRLVETFPHQYGPALTVWQKAADGRGGKPRLLLTLGKGCM